VFGLLANLGQAEVRGCFKTEQNWLATCQNCSINGFKLRTRPNAYYCPHMKVDQLQQRNLEIKQTPLFENDDLQINH
ncbi:hypothetical protein SDB65_14485, partial [Legionella pneumophila serogroup 1]